MNVPDILLQLVGGASLCIYIGAHASLARPPSAAPNKSTNTSTDDEDNQDEPDPSLQAGLDHTDAIILPLISALVLYGLYCLIMYLEDPEILNKIVRGYMSIVSLAAITSAYTQLLILLTSFVFPTYWRAGGNRMYEVDQPSQSHIALNASGASKPTTKFVLGPLPIGISSSELPGSSFLWSLRGILTQKWQATIVIKRVTPLRGKFTFRIQHIIGAILSVITVIAFQYSNTPLLSNIIAVSLCLMTFTILSPTTFTTGSLILVGLFVYDIVMVFYTPLMITVASKLDAPVKIVASSGGKATSMLGLGDIVLPGIVMSMALRFDLWRHYVNKIKYEEQDLKATSESGVESVVAKRVMAHKAKYVSVANKWGDWFWSSKWFSSSPTDLPVGLTAARFEKTYFIASMIGYVIGLLSAMGFMLVFKHGQPALLYLVPSVLISIWGTGFFRGEIKMMLKYTEDGSLDTRDQIVEVDADGKPIEKEKKKKPKKQESDDKEIFVLRVRELTQKQHFE